MTARSALAGLLVLLAAATGWAQDRPLNEQPMYGSAPKTPAMLEADRAFIAGIERQMSRAQGSDQHVQAGWQSFKQKRDIATAMKRFNQAWLLDPDNGDAYQGMAILVMQRDHDVAGAESLFKRALASKRRGSNVFVDYGRFLLVTKRPRDAIPILQQAVQLPGVSPEGQALLAMAYQEAGDARNACATARKVQPTIQPAMKTEIDRMLASAACR